MILQSNDGYIGILLFSQLFDIFEIFHSKSLKYYKTE